MPTEFWANAIYSVIPTIVLGIFFWFAMRSILRSDRSERSTLARIEAEERAKREAARAAATPEV